MANAAREKLSRRSWLLAGGTLPLFRAPLGANATPALRVSSDGDNLHVTAPELHFLAGKPLARLKDGNTAVFLSQLTLFREETTSGPRSIFRRAPERITVSYDVWEERFQANLAVYRRIAGRMSLTETEA